jgi:hypothetical protein
MSGSDGPSTGGIWPGGGDNDDCSSLRIDAWIAAPDPDHGFFVGEQLDVALDDQQTPTVELLTAANGASVGAVNPNPVLVRCLRRGIRFTATVTQADGAAVKVRIDETP